MQNTFLFGKIRSGKSTILKMLIAQDIRDKIGFFFLDPHRQNALDVITMIPPSIRDRIVYFSLAAPREFDEQCNRINPFEYEDDADRFDVVASFVSMLAHHYTNDGKFGMHLTLATQTVEKLSKTLAGDVTSHNQVIISFNSSPETEKLLAKTFDFEPKTITSLSTHMFMLWADTVPPIRCRGITKFMPSVTFQKIKPIIARCLETASKVNVDLYMPPLKNRHGVGPSLTPLEFFLLNTLYLEARDMSRDELIAAALVKFDVPPRKISEALFTRLTNSRYITQGIPQTDDGDSNDSMRLAITSLAMDTIYSKSIAGRRGGGDLHVSTQLDIMDMQLKNYNYCILDTAEKHTEKADLTVFTFKKLNEDEPTTAYTKFDPDFWSDEMWAIEVESDPSKHPPSQKNPISQIYQNYTKNKKNHYSVCFVVFSQKSGEILRDILAHYSVGKEQYHLIVLSPSVRISKNEQTHISSEEEKIIRTLDDIPGATAKKIIKASNLNPIEAATAIKSLEKKEILERSGTGTANSKPVWDVKQDLTQPASTQDKGEFSDVDSGQLLLLINDDPYNFSAKEELKKRGYTIKKKPEGGFSISKKKKQN